MAVVWRLPVVFVCENNLYMEYTPISAVTAVPNPAADRAPAYGLEGIMVDGNDPDAVFGVASDAIGRARRGQGPSLIEAKTYRQSGHSRADPGKYRPDDEVAAWLARDPIPTYRARLLADGVDETTLAEVDSRRGGGGRARDRRGEGVARAGRVVAADAALRGRRLVVAELTLREAIGRGIAQEMERDPSVYFIGEDVGRGGRGVQDDGRACRSGSATGACGTRRSPSRPSSA